MIRVLFAVVLVLAPAGHARADTDHPINDAATGMMVATRLNPPAPPVQPWPVLFSSESSGGRCVGAEFLLEHFSPGWDPVRMSRISFRESRCDPAARNRSSGSTGLLQILASHCPWLARQMGEPCTVERLQDPTFNVRAGAVLWVEQGYQAWAATS